MAGQSAQIAPDVGTVRPAQLEEVVVTAQRRSEQAQKVGIALSTITATQLDHLNLAAPGGITNHVAAVELVQPNGAGAYTLSIRGVTQNDPADHQESPTAIYVDGVYLSQQSGLAFQMLDMNNVEVLRGPQGTLFGRNATGGLAQFNTNRPTADTEGYFQETVGSFALRREDFALGGTLIKDLVEGRLAVEDENRDSFFHGVQGGRPSEDDDQRSARAEFTIELPKGADLLLISTYGRQHDIAGAWESVTAAVDAQGYGYDAPGLDGLGYGPTGAFGSRGDTRGYARNENYGQSATLSMPVKAIDAELHVTVDYQHLLKSYLEDSDTTPLDVFNFFSGSDVEQYSGEARLNGDVGPLKWITGLYLLGIDGGYNEGAHGEAYGGESTTGGLLDPYGLRTRSYALFGQVDYSFTDKLHLTVGGRYTRDDKVFNFSSSYPGFSFLFNTTTDGGLSRLNSGFWSGKIGLDYQATNTLLFYGSINKGVKAGGFNAPLDPTTITDLGQLRFSPETLYDTEVGFKNEFFDRRLRVNGSAYYYDYNNYQALDYINLTQLVHNAPATYKGGELEIVYQPIRPLQISGNIAYNHAAVHNIDLNGLGAHDYIPANAPRWNLNGMAAYTLPVDGGELTFQAEASFQTKEYFNLTDAPDTEQGDYAVGNLRAIYKIRHIELNLAITNVTDERYFVEKFDLASDFGLVQQYPGRPREVSFAAKYTF